jgi:hypothetical protein
MTNFLKENSFKVISSSAYDSGTIVDEVTTTK